jgi:hypothetical protein
MGGRNQSSQEVSIKETALVVAGVCWVVAYIIPSLIFGESDFIMIFSVLLATLFSGSIYGSIVPWISNSVAHGIQSGVVAIAILIPLAVLNGIWTSIPFLIVALCPFGFYLLGLEETDQ